MDTENGVVAAIKRAQMKARMLRVTRTHLAKEAGIGYNTLDGWQNDDWRPTTATLEKVEAALERLSR